MTQQHTPNNAIDSMFASLRASGKRGLMPFICGGHPRPGMTGELLRAVADGGASAIEIGFPFSDPIADGPVIAQAMDEALRGGCTLASLLKEIADARQSVTVPLIAMVSVSIVTRAGGARSFCDRLLGAGIDGCIFPDAPLEESGPLTEACAKRGLTSSLLIAPSTPIDRAGQIARASSGFVYVLARHGITGETGAAPDIGPRVASLRALTDLPLACGFGISTPEHVRAVAAHADAVIVGSALVSRIARSHNERRDPAAEALEFVRSLSTGLS